ncbi:MAG: vWA domain-containing protein, partial [Myxococcaceae bacterium]
AKNRKAPKEWLAALSAGGGTEMRSGILEALTPLRAEAQRQVVLITDGLIGSEHEVLQAIFERLPSSSRVHVVGVGSGVNRSLTGPASRAGRGVELVIGLGEDAERAAKRLVARTCAPLVTGLTVEGSAVLGFSPEKLPDLFGGAPALISLRLQPGGGDVVVRGRTEEGSFERRLHVPPTDFGTGSPAVAALYAREAVEDLEMRLAVGEDREQLDPRIELLGLAFQISTRLTSWVAVSDEVMVDPTEATRRESVPQELPFGMSAEGLGLRRAVFAPSPAAEPAEDEEYSYSTKTQAGVYKPLMQRARGGAGGPLGGIAGKAKQVLGRLFDSGAPADEPAAGPGYPEEKKESGAEREVARSAPMAPAGRPAASPPPAKSSPAPSSSAGAAPSAQAVVSPRRLTGTVRLLKGLELIVEVLIDGAVLEWELPSQLTAAWDDGSVSTAEVDPKKSSRPQTAAPGVVVRLALTLPAGRGGKAPKSLLLSCRGVMLEIVL